MKNRRLSVGGGRNGTLTGSFNLSLNDSLTWTGGTMGGAGATSIASSGRLALGGAVKYLTERTINNAGAALWTAGDFYTGSGASFVNQTGATFDTNFDGTFHYNLGGAVSAFTNAGTSTKSGGAGATIFYVGSIEGTGNIFLGANELTVGASNLSTTFSGILQNGGITGGTGARLTKVGTGTLTLGGANTYSGATQVMDGALLLNGDHSAATGSLERAHERRLDGCHQAGLQSPDPGQRGAHF